MKFFKTKPDRKRNSLFRVRVENDRQGTADQILSRAWPRYAQNRPEESFFFHHQHTFGDMGKHRRSIDRI